MFMVKKTLFFCVLLVFFCGSLWAGGGREANISLTADDPSGFTDVINTLESTPGKWNYFLEARDRAGNIALSGPENIFIDPESDLPRVTIINPMPNMRVQGNLNLVGIAVDDDGVEEVWLTVSRGRDGRGEELVRIKADGADYWSYFLDTTDPEIWTDGVYTVTAWAIDINGLSGIAEYYPNGTRVPPRAHKTHSVYWHLDRKKPETIVTSHDAGALVSGRIRLRGTVNDGNGIAALSYSMDGGNRYLPVRFSTDRRTGENTWEINLNTNTFEDGPAVIWFQALDRQGSVGTAAHLLFVNNTGPDVQIVYPEPNTVVNGLFTIAGYASHPVGLRSVSWRAGRDLGGDIDLIIGNHWWSAEVDLRGVRTNSVDIEIRAVDVSGNVTVSRQRYRVDQDADRPVVTIYQPSSNIIIGEDGNLVVKGSARDNDGVASIFYSFNNEPPVEIPTSGYFQFLIPSITTIGNNTLDIWARDITGVEGPRAQVRGIVVPGPLPEPRITTFAWGRAKTENFDTGMTISPLPIYGRTGVQTGLESIVMNVSVRAATAPESMTIQIGDRPIIPVRLAGNRDVFTGSVPFPNDLQEGLTRIRLTATDRMRRVAVYDEYIFFRQPVALDPQQFAGMSPDEIREMQAFTAATQTPGEYSFNWIRIEERLLEDGRILLRSSDDTIKGLANMPLNENATLSGAGAGNINVEIDLLGRLIITTMQEGNFGPFTLSLETRDGHSFQSEPFSILADFTPPRITVLSEPEKWIQTSVNDLRFNVSSTNNITAVEYSVDMGDTWLSLLTPAQLSALRAPVSNYFSPAIDLTDAQDGAIDILIRATNEAGRIAISSFSVIKDTQPPQARLVMPIADARVNGTIRMGFSIREMGVLRTVTYNRPASAGVPAIVKEIYNIDDTDNELTPLFLEVVMDSMEMPLDENMTFTFVDMAGNTSVVSAWEFIIDNEMDIPIVHIILPLENEVITTDFIVSGVMYDDDAIKQIYWSLNGGEEHIVVAENAFSIPISISTLTDNEHFVTVIAEDIYGVKSEPVTRNFRVSLSEPAARITYPLFDTVLRDTVVITGDSFDRNGIREVQVSLDNGNTFNTVHGNFGTPAETVEWRYEFNTKILKDGPNVVFIRVFDNYDIPATYASMINVDNTPPEIVLDSPRDGAISVRDVTIMGRVLDPNLERVRIETRSLTGSAVREDLRTIELGAVPVIRQNLNFTGQADGLYNIEIVATDSAGNITRVSRNIELARETFRNTIDIYYPLENEIVSGEFNLYGWAGGTDHPGTVTIRINDRDVTINEVDDSGFWRFTLNAELLDTGTNTIVVHSDFGGNARIESRSHQLIYRTNGPWVTIDSFNFGDFAFERPYLYGRTGYLLTEEDIELLADRNTDRAVRAAIRDKAPSFTEISFDNGKTFQPTNRALARDMDYRFRLETGEMTEGLHYILVRSTMRNGETAVTRMLVQVDKTPPVIRLISPEPGGRYNTEIAFSASATDDVELYSLTYHLRIGDKAAYAIPGFLQGLYIETTIPPFIRQINNNAPVVPFGGGATFMDIGLGLSFFDDNVKVQGQYGFLFQDQYEGLGGIGPVRYGGHVLGLKLLASIYTLPLGAVWGPDFDWLSASFSIGANFSLFDAFSTENSGYPGTTYTQSGTPTWMSALLLQIEFPKVTIPKRTNFRTFSLFTEGQLWFVPTDVNAEELGIETILPKVIMGVRMYIF
jgi:hypothetical protein